MSIALNMSSYKSKAADIAYYIVIALAAGNARRDADDMKIDFILNLIAEHRGMI